MPQLIESNKAIQQTDADKAADTKKLNIADTSLFANPVS